MNLRKCFKLFTVVACLMTVLCGCGLFKTKINLQDYISYSYEGISGYTSIAVDLDKDGIRADFGEKIGEKKMNAFDALVDSLAVSISQTENLTNGDVVVIDVGFNEEDCDNAGVSFSGNNLEINIEGLREGELLDVFADINVNVTGIAPFATASIENKSDNVFVQGLTYSLDVTGGFREGDVLNLTCNIDADQAGEAGYVVLSSVEQFSTAGIPYYVETPDKLDMSMLSAIVEEGKTTVSAETESSLTRMLYKVTGSSNFLFQYNKEWIDSIELQEIRLLTCNDPLQFEMQNIPYNKLWIIFKAYVTNADHGSDGYFCFEYSDIIINSDGTMSIKHDNPNLRYMCDDDYNQLMEAVLAKNAGLYTEQPVDIAGIVPIEASGDNNQENVQTVVQ